MFPHSYSPFVFLFYLVSRTYTRLLFCIEVILCITKRKTLVQQNMTKFISVEFISIKFLNVFAVKYWEVSVIKLYRMSSGTLLTDNWWRLYLETDDGKINWNPHSKMYCWTIFSFLFQLLTVVQYFISANVMLHLIMIRIKMSSWRVYGSVKWM